MNRREFIQSLAVLGITASHLPTALLASNNKTWKQKYETALKFDPRLIGHQNYTQERQAKSLFIEGGFPKDFSGTFYRNGPALLERADVRQKHLFDGDGMIHAFKFENGNVSFKNKFVQTYKYQKEQKAGRFLYDLSDLGLKTPESVTSADTINNANTNILPVGDEIWALWEAGSAYGMHPETLETKGAITLNTQLKGAPFSAHPKIDADGTIWNFGLDYSSGQIIVYKLNPKGVMQKFGIVKTDYHAMLHDFLITDKHILLVLPSLRVNPKGKGFAAQQQFDENRSLRVLVVDKNDFSLKATHEFPACFLFHFGNAWEEKDGTIRFDGCRYPNLEVLNRMENIMQGDTFLMKDTISQTVIFTIYPDGKTKQEAFAGSTEFPRIYPALTGKRNEKIFTIGDTKNAQWADSIRSMSIDTGKIDQYVYGEDYLVEEHVLIEKPKQKGGYLIGTALNWKKQQSCVSLFDAENIKAGPLARAWLEFHIPLGFHGNFKMS